MLRKKGRFLEEFREEQKGPVLFVERCVPVLRCGKTNVRTCYPRLRACLKRTDCKEEHSLYSKLKWAVWRGDRLSVAFASLQMVL